MSITALDFDFVRQLVKDRSAIVLETEQRYLAETRLTPMLREVGAESIADLLSRLRNQPYGVLHRRVVEVMATHETSFFRDAHPFVALERTIVPALMRSRAAERALNIWSAACSSGQEPYSIAMLLREKFPELGGWDVRIDASDFSQDTLERAQSGVYSQLEINRGLPVTMLLKYFSRASVAEWRVCEEIRQRVYFSVVNLLGSWSALPKMDIVFMRNVLIYFDTPTKKTILGRVRKLLRPDGVLFLGGAETVLNLDDQFERVALDKTSCYRLRRQ